MSNKKAMHLIFTKDAPEDLKNGVRITFGTAFSRLFKQSEEPFQVPRNIGDAILRNYDYFEKSAAAPAEEPTLSGLKKLAREVLDVKAREYGVEKPEDLPNKEAVAKAILKAVAEKSVSDDASNTSSAEPVAQPLDPNKGEITVTDEDSETESSEEKSDETEKEQG